VGEDAQEDEKAGNEVNEMTKIALGMAVGEYIRSQTTGMLVALFRARPDMKLIIKQSPYLHDNREQVIDDFLKTDCTHLFFVDSDMLFGPEVLDYLLKQDKDIIGAQYNRRMGKEGVSVAPSRYDLEGMSPPNRPFINQVVATGCLLIKREVFKRIPKPWFSMGTPENWLGEDVYFSKKARENGVEVYLDDTQRIGHIGEFTYWRNNK